MTKTIRQLIELESYAACEKQKAADMNIGGSRWTAHAEDCYEMGFETGALWAMRWWAERWQLIRLGVELNANSESPTKLSLDTPVDELDTAAKEILEGKV